MHIQGRDTHNMVSIDFLSILIHRYAAISISIIGYANIGFIFQYCSFQVVYMGGTATLIDIEPVGLIAYADHPGPQLFPEHGGSGICGSIGTIYHHTYIV